MGYNFQFGGYAPFFAWGGKGVWLNLISNQGLTLSKKYVEL